MTGKKPLQPLGHGARTWDTKPESTDAGFQGGVGVLCGQLEAAWRCAEGVIATA